VADPTWWERPVFSRDTTAYTRTQKPGHGVIELRTRSLSKADEDGWKGVRLAADIAGTAGQPTRDEPGVTIDQIRDELSTGRPDRDAG
jgi:hypothetical protein